MVYILDFVSKIMGIQLNTLEFNGARPSRTVCDRPMIEWSI